MLFFTLFTKEYWEKKKDQGFHKNIQQHIRLEKWCWKFSFDHGNKWLFNILYIHIEDKLF